ncbi:hypothetical protein F4778DRAFT_112526 [Xylariomycetidae sp. FL2044]|nr:hypothetical protein F4778DRAFT_112526 [Xylariomycetidae sp. FL2044]
MAYHPSSDPASGSGSHHRGEEAIRRAVDPNAGWCVDDTESEGAAGSVRRADASRDPFAMFMTDSDTSLSSHIGRSTDDSGQPPSPVQAPPPPGREARGLGTETIRSVPQSYPARRELGDVSPPVIRVMGEGTTLNHSTPELDKLETDAREADAPNPVLYPKQFKLYSEFHGKDHARKTRQEFATQLRQQLEGQTPRMTPAEIDRIVEDETAAYMEDMKNSGRSDH